MGRGRNSLGEPAPALLLLGAQGLEGLCDLGLDLVAHRVHGGERVGLLLGLAVQVGELGPQAAQLGLQPGQLEGG